MNTLQQMPLHDGHGVALPDGVVSRGVFDHMGTHVAHIEYPISYANMRPYVIAARIAGPIEPTALYLGAVAEVYGSHVVHYYAVPA